MIKVGIGFDRKASYRAERQLQARAERAALVGTDRAATRLKDKARDEFARQGYGRTGMALGSTSDLKGNGVHRRGPVSFSASGTVYIRNRGARSVGTIISATEGATIRPVKGRWLWIATDDVKRLVGIPTAGGGRTRKRLEPHLWDQTYGPRLGPLVAIKGASGAPVLVVKNATVSLSGKPGSLRGRTKTGRVPKGQVAQEFTVAFYAIPFTQRTAKVDARALALAEARTAASELKSAFEVTANG
jgi:hypothetical protein